ncbi:MAG TPA: MCP four helix bundle domain-containing protein, partial [Phycisphaerales bacterium]|nr:MCP four helix bundle domain-containing protein [Phycisphaerales bacterium]
MQFKNFSIGVRLGIGFAVLLLLLVAAQVIASSRVSTISGRLTRINDVNSVKQRYAINFRGSVHDRSILMRDLVLFEKPEDIRRTVDEINLLARNYADSAVKLDELMSDPALTNSAERKALADIKAVESRTLPLLDNVVAGTRDGVKQQGVMEVVNAARPEFSEWLRVINVFIDMQEETNKTMGAEARSVAATFNTWMIAFGVCAVVFGGCFAWFLVRSISNPISELKQAFAKVAEGDLRTR